jgi:hypothetical protein
VSTQEVVIIGVTLIGPVLSSTAVWLRLRLQSRGMREHRRFLLNAVTALPAGSRIQVHPGDGTRVVLIVGATGPNEEQRRTRNSSE